MSYVFEDTETLAINADWLNLFEPSDCFSSPRRPVPRCKNLYWWIECYPNGLDEEDKHNVSVYVLISAGGFEFTKTVTILRSNVKYQDTKFLSKSTNEGWATVISHDQLRLGDTIKDGTFAIKCDVKFKVPMETVEILKKAVLFKDIYTAKFNRTTIETYKPGQNVVERKQNVGGITWWIEYNPCGNTEAYKGYVSVYFHISGGPITTEYSCAMSVDGVILQKSGFFDFGETANWGYHRHFSHKLCKLADHNDGIIDFVCEVRFFKPALPIFVSVFNQTVIDATAQNTVSVLGSESKLAVQDTYDEEQPLVEEQPMSLQGLLPVIQSLSNPQIFIGNFRINSHNDSYHNNQLSARNSESADTYRNTTNTDNSKKTRFSADGNTTNTDSSKITDKSAHTSHLTSNVDNSKKVDTKVKGKISWS